VEEVLAIQPPELQPIFSSETATHETRIATNNKMRWMMLTMKNLEVQMTQAATWMRKTWTKIPIVKRVTDNDKEESDKEGDGNESETEQLGFSKL
jgi:hypothetical protein